MTLTGDTHCQPHLKRIAFWQERILVNSRGNFQAEPLMSLLCVSANLSETVASLLRLKFPHGPHLKLAP